MTVERRVRTPARRVGGDRWWTGGGYGTVNLGNGNNLMFGTETFTGNSFSTMSVSKPYDNAMPTYNIGSKTGYHYAGQQYFDSQTGKTTGYNQSLNMGQSFLRINSSSGTFQISNSGQAHMYSQNLIHDYLIGGFHRFLSTTPNQFNFTGEINTGTK